MINYVYCSTNPEQKAIAQGFCSYDFVNPVPIYDQYSTKDYAKKTLKGLYGKTIVQWSPAIQDTVNEFYFDWWLPDNFCDIFQEKSLCSSRKYIVSSQLTHDEVLSKYKIYSKILLRCGPVGKIRKKYKHVNFLRVGILGGLMKHVNLKKIYKSFEESNIKNFELFVKGQGEYKLHDNTKTDSEILSECPKINITDYDLIDMDLIVCSQAQNESSINQCLAEGVSLVSAPTRYAKHIQAKYNCIAVATAHNYGGFALKALSPEIKHGRTQMGFLHNQDNFKNIFHEKTIKYDIPESLRTINVFCLFRNNENSIGQTLSGLKASERRLGADIRYYIYENDSSDDTPNQIKDFYKHSFGNYNCEILGNKEHAGDSRPERLRDLAIYRNKMKELCHTWHDSDYSFIVDSEIAFEHDIFIKMISSMNSSSDIVMVTPFGTPHFNNEYYDTFALLDKANGKNAPSSTEKTEVNSAFCGFVCIRTEVFQKCFWDSIGNKSEHLSFCERVRQCGKIIVDPSIKVKWTK